MQIFNSRHITSDYEGPSWRPEARPEPSKLKPHHDVPGVSRESGSLTIDLEHKAHATSHSNANSSNLIASIRQFIDLVDVQTVTSAVARVRYDAQRDISTIAFTFNALGADANIIVLTNQGDPYAAQSLGKPLSRNRYERKLYIKNDALL